MLSTETSDHVSVMECFLVARTEQLFTPGECGLLPNGRFLLGNCTYVDCATRAFSSKPRGEKGGRVEVMLKVADYLG